MKKTVLTCLLTLLLLFTAGCEKTSEDYTNIQLNEGCFHIGDTVCYYLAGLERYHAAYDKIMTEFCSDPLCDHSGLDGVCPDCWNLEIGAYVTDGERFYINARSFLPDANGEYNLNLRQIFSFLPDGSDMKCLLSFDSANGTQPNLSIDGDWLYYYQNFYSDSYDPADQEHTVDDTYTLFMRLNTKSGKTEQVLPGTFTRNDRLYPAGEYYALLRSTEAGNVIDFYDRSDGSLIAENLQPKNRSVICVNHYRGECYLLCANESTTVSYTIEHTDLSYSLYRLTDDLSFTCLIEDIGLPTHLTFSGGAAWYSPHQFTYLGTKDMPTGRGSETAPYDFIEYTDGSVVRYDLESGETTRWQSEGVSLRFCGLSNGYAILKVRSPEKEFSGEAYESGTYKAELNEDESVTLVSRFAESDA